MTKVYFVRHAEPDLSYHDEMRPLSEKGMKDRERVTEFLSDKDISAVLSSPYRRAVDTVADFAENYSHHIVTVPGLRERAVGEWTEDFGGFAERQWIDFGYKLAGGESLGEVQRRNIAALKKLLEEYADKNIAVGTHGTALSTVINYYDSTFGYDDFRRIQHIMPWIVCLCFEGERYLGREEYII